MKNLCRIPTLSIFLPVIFLAGLLWNSAFLSAAREDTSETTAGFARVDITPHVPVRMVGYASRDYEGKPMQDRLFARAIAIGDGEGPKAIMITADLLGIPRYLRDRVLKRIKAKLDLPPEQFAISATHTHGGPSLSNYMQETHFCEVIPAIEKEHIDEYTNRLVDQLEKVAVEAAANLRPAILRWGEGKATFAMNRRHIENGVWKGMRPNPKGSVDHRVPTLTAVDATNEKKVLGVFLSYACHCTSYAPPRDEFHGDWAGEAAAAVEKRHPGSVALVAAGCGADANPNPRTADAGPLVKERGEELADQVDMLLSDPAKTWRLAAAPVGHLKTAVIPLSTTPTKADFQSWTESKNKRRAFYGQMWLDRIAAGKPVPASFDYLVQAWRFPAENDREVKTVFLPGEVVAGYSLRIRDDYDSRSVRHWTIGYANESPCYITTAKQIAEGGYEVEQSMISYDKTAPLDPECEEIIMAAVGEAAGSAKKTSRSHAAGITPRPEPADQPLSAKQSLATMHVPEGYRVELVAAEPLVMDPVAFDWGADGRLWVAEMRDYPNGLTWNGIDDPLNEPGGRIKVLTDTDGDGRYDDAEIFLDGLNYPTGVKVWDKGILVTAAPEIFYAEDTDGDDKADKRETWYSGFARSNQQHRVNGLAWGLDNWLHVANGDGGGVILSKETRDEVDIRGLDLRIDPYTKKHEPLSGRTQCGRYRDDWGNWFGCNNSNPIWHFPMPWNRLQRNSDLSPPSPTVNVPKTPGAAPVFPVSKTEERFNQPDRANRFTSVCGPNVYRDNVLGDELQGNIFICEPVHNLVSRQVVEARGATFLSDRHPSEKESEFFASTDNWSRPVSMRTGPDGAIWVADMYRRVIEHPEWIPIDRQKEVEIRAGDDLGRIYRIVPDDDSKLVVPKLDDLDNIALASQLNTENGTVRDFVHQMLSWRKANDAAPAIAALATGADSPAVRVQGLCALDGLGMIDEKTLATSLTDPHPGVVRHAIRLSPRRVDEATLIRSVAPHLGDSFVAMELAGVLGEAKTKESQDLLAAVLLRHRSDPHVTAIALSSVNRKNITNIARVLTLAYFDPPAFRERLSKFDPGLKAPSNELTRTLAGYAVKWKIPEAVDAYVEALVRTAESEGDLPKAWRVSLLLGLLQSAPDLDAVTSDANAKEVIRDLIGKARALSVSSDGPAWSRLEAIRLLGSSAVYSEKLDLPLLTSLLQTKNDPALREAAFSTLSKTRGTATAASLIGQWKHLPPADRSKVQNLLLGRGEWAEALLSAVETGTIPPAQIDAAGRSRLLESESKDFKKRAEKLFASASNPNREKVLAEWKSVVKMEGDAESGKQIFATACIACHVAEGQGNAIGPDLAAISDRSREALLVAILDPNRAVEDKFVTWNVKTTEGASHLGLVANESANDFTLRGPDGSELKVLRSEIDSMSSIGISLMPEGLEAAMTKAQMADLITYVASLGSPAKPEPVLSARVRPGGKGVVELRASKCKIDGEKIEYMPDFDALGWWTSEKDRAGWTVVLDRPGTYRVEWEYSVSPESAGNKWQLVVNGKKALGGKVESTGSWETFKTQSLGEIDLPGADNSFVIRSEGPLDNALLDLRWVKLIPVEK